MATRTFNWCTECELDCSPSLPTTGYACVPAALLDPVPELLHGFVQVVVQSVRKSTCNDPCCGWVYTLTYDDAQLQSGRTLQQSNVAEVFCTNCLIDFIVTQSGGTADCDAINECVCFEATESITPSVNEEGCNEFDVNVSANAGNALTIESGGLFVPEAQATITVSDTASVDLTFVADVLSADVVISATSGNQVSVAGDGLLVSKGAGLTVTDTSSVDLTLISGALSADAKVSADTGNAVVVHSDGLFVPNSAVGIGLDGWTNPSESWSYASAGVITVPSDATTKYQIGDCIKIDQLATTKYFKIVAVPTTTSIKVVGDVTAPLTSDPISNNYYSHQASPIGFPPFFTWAPVVVPVAPMTYTSQVIYSARFSVEGSGRVNIELEVGGTIGGTPTNELKFEVPVVVTSNPSIYHPCWTADGSEVLRQWLYAGGAYGQVYSPSVVVVWSAGTDRVIKVSGFYWIS